MPMVSRGFGCVWVLAQGARTHSAAPFRGRNTRAVLQARNGPEGIKNPAHEGPGGIARKASKSSDGIKR